MLTACPGGGRLLSAHGLAHRVHAPRVSAPQATCAIVTTAPGELGRAAGSATSDNETFCQPDDSPPGTEATAPHPALLFEPLPVAGMVGPTRPEA